MTSINESTGTRTDDLAPGRIVEGVTFADRYAIEGRLGEGAHAVVLAALDIGTNPPRRVALKVARTGEVGEMNLRNEAESIARIHQARIVNGVVRLFEPGVQYYGDTSFLVLECIEGPTLRDLSRRSHLTTNDILDLSRALARALSAVHEVSLVIADVKPDNIVLREGRDPVLVDFGAARAVGEHVEPGFLTPAYAAPEQLAGGPAVPASDVYALAIILEELMRHSRLPHIALLVANCMAVDPTSRPSALAFAEAFERACTSLARSRAFLRVFAMAALFVGLAMTSTHAVGIARSSSSATVQPPKVSLTSMVPPSRGYGRPSHLALGERHLYWTAKDRLYRSPLAGGNPEVVAYFHEEVRQIAVALSTAYFRTERGIWTWSEREYLQLDTYPGSGGDIAADDQGVVWTNPTTGEVSSLGRGGALPKRVLATRQRRPGNVALDGQYVYWSNWDDASIARVSREGGVVDIVVPGDARHGPNLNFASPNLVLDETHVYCVDHKQGAIMRISKGGGRPEPIVQIGPWCGNLALNETHLYWSCAENFEGEIWRLPKEGVAPELLTLTKGFPSEIVVRGDDLFFLTSAIDGQKIGLMRLSVQ